MAWCTVADVKTIVTPESLTDSDISDIVDNTYDDLTCEVGGGASATTSLISANKHLAAAHVLGRMKFNGELAASVKFGTESQSNSIDDEIKYHTDRAARFIQMYKRDTSGYSILYGRSGIRTVNNKE